jgi:DNA-binding MarR family transcriptional regulator
MSRSLSSPRAGRPAERRRRKIESAGGCACFALRRAARAVTQLYDEALRPSGLRVTQFTVLQITSRLGSVALGQLARASAMDRTTLTRSLALLERDGLVEPAPRDDRRERRFRVTEPGEQALRAAFPRWERAQSRLAELYGSERLRRLLRALAALDVPSAEN